MNFVLAGFHHVVVYAPGKIRRKSISRCCFRFPWRQRSNIDDPQGRIYRGLDPAAATPQDRVEVVNFSTRGTYLVICAVNVHFNDGMFGWVRVLA